MGARGFLREEPRSAKREERENRVSTSCNQSLCVLLYSVPTITQKLTVRPIIMSDGGYMKYLLKIDKR